MGLLAIPVGLCKDGPACCHNWACVKVGLLAISNAPKQGWAYSLSKMGLCKGAGWACSLSQLGLCQVGLLDIQAGLCNGGLACYLKWACARLKLTCFNGPMSIKRKFFNKE